MIGHLEGFGSMTATRIFLSYAREDSDAAQRLDRELSADHSLPLEVWFDQRSLAGGSNWKSAIRRAIRSSDVFLLLLSKASTTKAGYVQREIREALEILKSLPESDVFVVPLRIEDCDVHFEFLEELQRIDLFPDWDAGMARLRETLRAHAGYAERDAISARIRSKVQRIIQAQNIEPYVFTPDFWVRGRTSDGGHRSIGLSGGIFTSTGSEPEWLFNLVTVYRGDDAFARAALLLREALDLRAAETKERVKARLQMVIPSEISQVRFEPFLDLADHAWKILDREGGAGITREESLDEGVVGFLDHPN